MNDNKKIITKSFEETRQVGFEFAKTLKGGEVLTLHGDLGAGKTTFMQGLARGLGITRNILSPTFIIMRSYDIAHAGNTGKKLYHVDLYRIESEKDIDAIGLPELMGDTEAIVAIEWPEKIENVLPKKKREIFLEYIDENKRQISFE